VGCWAGLGLLGWFRSGLAQWLLGFFLFVLNLFPNLCFSILFFDCLKTHLVGFWINSNCKLLIKCAKVFGNSRCIVW
jgi:hypothetical protein